MTPFQSKVLMLARLGEVEPQISNAAGNPLIWALGKRNVTATVVHLINMGELHQVKSSTLGGTYRLPRLE